MTHRLKNRIRALFLLLVFSFNTIAGFACSVGVDMGYNAYHHEHAQKHFHNHGQEHHNYSHTNHKGTTAFKDVNEKKDCCSNDVTKFALLDKLVVDNSLSIQAPVFFIAISTGFHSQTINESGLAVNSGFQYVRRSSFLNDTDIQTAIRRFQI